jgi:hypothetical protein
MSCQTSYAERPGPRLRDVPLAKCRRTRKPEEELTPERVAASLLAQEVEWFRAAAEGDA